MKKRNAARLDPELRDEIIAEHRQLGDLVGQLERAVDPARLPSMIEGLETVLARHFEREEAPDGLYDVLRSKVAGDHGPVDALRSEHGALRSDVAELSRRTREQPDSPALRRDVSLFCQRLREHERRESMLLIDTLSRQPPPGPDGGRA